MWAPGGLMRGTDGWSAWLRTLALVACLVSIATLASFALPPAAASEPEANFQGKPSRGGVPLFVEFTDTSNALDVVIRA